MVGSVTNMLSDSCVYLLDIRSMEAANRPHREVTTKRVTSFTTSDRSDSPAMTADNHMDGKMPHGTFINVSSPV